MTRAGAALLCRGLQANTLKIPLMMKYPAPMPIAVANVIVVTRTKAVTK
jgi:hypothetical protein